MNVHLIAALAVACAASLASANAWAATPPAADSARALASNVSADASADDDASAGDDLHASWEKPWNPERPVPRRRGWEQVMLAPQRIATLPVTAVGRGIANGLQIAEERGWVPTGAPPEADKLRHGVFAIEPARLGGSVGFGAAAALRYNVMPGRTRTQVLLRQAYTVHGYQETTIGLLGAPAWFEYHNAWRPRDPYYGEGPAARLENRSNFSTRYETARVGLRFTRGTKEEGGINTVAVYTGPRTAVTGRGHEPDRASIEQQFPAVAAPVLDRRVDHEVYGLQLLHDARTGAPHWSRGWRGALSFERYGGPLRALTLRSTDEQGARFWTMTGEGEAALSFWMRDPRTLRAFVHFENRHVLSGRDRFLPGDLGTLGGSAGLSGFNTGRFHGLDVLLTRLAYVFPVSRRLELDVHSEWGNTFEHWNDAKPSRLEHSAGVALRARWEKGPLASIGVDASNETVRLTYSIGGVR